MRSVWKGAVAFGLVNVPVRLYSATTDHDIRFHQVHRGDGGRIRYKRTCDVCGQEVSYAEIDKGYETDDGRVVTLTKEDFESLPVASGHEIDVVEFVPADDVDPLLLDRSYYLEPDEKALKPYALLREALAETERMALVKIALRQRESLAVLRVRDKVIVLQTMLWPDELRQPEFPLLDREVTVRRQEVTMASSLVESLAAPFEPARFEDDYKAALEALIDAKLTGGEVRSIEPGAAKADDGDLDDLVSALRRSVDAAKARSGASGSARPRPPRRRVHRRLPPRRRPPARLPRPRRHRPRRHPRREGTRQVNGEEGTGEEDGRQDRLHSPLGLSRTHGLAASSGARTDGGSAHGAVPVQRRLDALLVGRDLTWTERGAVSGGVDEMRLPELIQHLGALTHQWRRETESACRARPQSDCLHRPLRHREDQLEELTSRGRRGGGHVPRLAKCRLVLPELCEPVREVGDVRRAQRLVPITDPDRWRLSDRGAEEVAAEHRLDGRPVQLGRTTDHGADLAAAVRREHTLSQPCT
jgi:DNA end-binding protein Ku